MSTPTITTTATVNFDLQELREVRTLVAMAGIANAATGKPHGVLDRLQRKLKQAAVAAHVEVDHGPAVVRTFVMPRRRPVHGTVTDHAFVPLTDRDVDGCALCSKGRRYHTTTVEHPPVDYDEHASNALGRRVTRPRRWGTTSMPRGPR